MNQAFPSNNSPEQRDQRGAFVTTYSGTKFFIEDCNVEDIPLLDIAHALSMNCRFNGHLAQFYSVAEHSVHVSHLVLEHTDDYDLALWGLLHDISEAFVPDIPRPFKAVMTGFEEFEEKIMRAAAPHFGLLTDTMPDEVKYIDKNIVADEARKFYTSPPEWIEYYESVIAPDRLKGYDSERAKWLFLEQFNHLQMMRKLG